MPGQVGEASLQPGVNSARRFRVTALRALDRVGADAAAVIQTIRLGAARLDRRIQCREAASLLVDVPLKTCDVLLQVAEASHVSSELAPDGGADALDRQPVALAPMPPRTVR